MGDMTNHLSRRPAGTPSGGQFAPTTNSEATASLAGSTSPIEGVELRADGTAVLDFSQVMPGDVVQPGMTVAEVEGPGRHLGTGRSDRTVVIRFVDDAGAVVGEVTGRPDAKLSYATVPARFVATPRRQADELMEARRAAAKAAADAYELLTDNGDFDTLRWNPDGAGPGDPHFPVAAWERAISGLRELRDILDAQDYEERYRLVDPGDDPSTSGT